MTFTSLLVLSRTFLIIGSEHTCFDNQGEACYYFKSQSSSCQQTFPNSSQGQRGQGVNAQ